MVLERFWWGPSLDLLRDSPNGALWLEHCIIVLLKALRSWAQRDKTFQEKVTLMDKKKVT